jgi:pimeloyl-ACP methyl ester carboxylesterase
MAAVVDSIARIQNELSVRSDVFGMTISDRVHVRGSALDHLSPRLVLLIHGFQNSEEKARRSYESFRRALRAAMWISDENSIGSFWEFHWPGDHPSGMISLATYSVRVPEAREAGRLLAEHLDTMNENQEVILVAHSLGCRVALETVRFVRDNRAYSGAHIRSVCLMAAAVPDLLCVGEGRPFARVLPDCNEHVLFSTHDRILFLAFSIGQHLYGEKGTAVGLRGTPIGRWPRTMPTGLGHSGYWSSFHVAEYIGTALGQATWKPLRQDFLPEAELPGP